MSATSVVFPRPHFSRRDLTLDRLPGNVPLASTPRALPLCLAAGISLFLVALWAGRLAELQAKPWARAHKSEPLAAFSLFHVNMFTEGKAHNETQS
jgi:hypothetical protein